MNQKIYNKIMSGNSDNNIRFADLRSLIIAFGFVERIKGDHHVYKNSEIPEGIVIQPLGNKAKAYQVKQVRNIFKKYGL